ncbi:N-acetyltransferase [Cupriavidus basilensis]|uniref:N-acetyltransferase n=1 Tax=Cupriavidus basilensis TaxID=68895 RepID=UPI0020A640CD|nr:N-acetyltransferase [Cupriavidus basilensis]MCP3024538.1 N-acetyltransferase [Cupriavidus basilensis]
MKNLSYELFSDVDKSDEFFESLTTDYKEFPIWFAKKAKEGEKAYLYRHGGIQGFLYLKIEEGVVSDVIPSLPAGRHLKVGTFKINGHGTRLGQRFIKKIFDHALDSGVVDAYVTVFAKHANLLRILKTYGFTEHGKKNSGNGEELVLVKDFKASAKDILLDYPRVSRKSKNAFLLAIYPEYHTQFLPDSKLNNESFDIVEDVSHANSIHKIYISGVAAAGKLERGDILVMYRTTDIPGKAHYRSVATSICVVEETRKIGSFSTEREFIRYVRPYSVFKMPQLTEYYISKKRHIVIKFTYNIALAKRLIRKRLLEEVGLPAGGRRWDFLKLTGAQFDDIADLGQINESYIID